MNLDIKLDLNEIFDKAFAALAKAMNIAEEQLLPIMAKQMFIEGVTGLVTIAFFGLALLSLIIVAFIFFKKGYDNAPYVCIIAAVIFGIFYLGFLFGEGYLLDSVTKTFNPEYAVITEVVDIAKGLLNDGD